MTGGRFRWPVRVYYEDTDAAGIVYYANYLKFMERARTEWLRSFGFEQAALARDHGVAFVVSRVEVRFVKPARLDELLQVVTSISRLGRVGFDMTQSVNRDGRERLCDAWVRIGCLDSAALEPRPLPSALLTELRRED